MDPVLEAIKNQDERFDGSGSPESKKGDDIPLLAQIVGLAKHFDRLINSEFNGSTPISIREALFKMNEIKSWNYWMK